MKAYYVPWLHMHQPLIWWKTGRKEELISNLEKMLLSEDKTQEWNAKLMLRAYKNPAKYVKLLKESGYEPRIMLDFSGILLESLKRMKGKTKRIEVEGEKIGDIIGLYKKVMKTYPDCIEFAGTAYAHCYFPATPTEDWEMQIEEWRRTFKQLFGAKALRRVKGFWLPEMGVPRPERLEYLLQILKNFGYEWVILPPEVVDGFEKLSMEGRIKIFCRPHKLKVKNEEIIAFVKTPYYFLDQQAGCDASCVYQRCLDALRNFKTGKQKPPIIVPASDGENGNVMMNKFFPETFLPFFKKSFKYASSLTLSQFLKKFYKKIETTVRIKESGGSWIGGHERWVEGYKKVKILEMVRNISKLFHKIQGKLKQKNKKLYEMVRKLLLISETSCYVYWGTTFWFTQGLKTIEKIEKMLLYLK